MELPIGQTTLNHSGIETIYLFGLFMIPIVKTSLMVIIIESAWYHDDCRRRCRPNDWQLSGQYLSGPMT